MKFNFWFDLPEALVNIAQDDLSSEEIQFSKLLIKSQEVNKQITLRNLQGCLGYLTKI